jgi:hypothetical protein
LRRRTGSCHSLITDSSRYHGGSAPRSGRFPGYELVPGGFVTLHPAWIALPLTTAHEKDLAVVSIPVTGKSAGRVLRLAQKLAVTGLRAFSGRVHNALFLYLADHKETWG